jgi:cytidylate kinase
MIVTIDGPAGVGKSTATRALAQRLGYAYLDTGAMYRAVALALMRTNVPFEAESVSESVLASLQIQLAADRIYLNGEDVTSAIRTPEVSQGASRVAVMRAVRQFLASEQRKAAVGRDIVCEGRDQGTFVFPAAECKFFLTAEPWVRAERRAAELAARGEAVSVEKVLADQEARDQRDAERDFAPMRPAQDAVIVDTTHMTTTQVIEELERLVRTRCRQPTV